MSRKVAVLGAGVAGLTAAHELAERGFDVTVVERRDVAGGKARSFTSPEGYPAEHGFRFFPGWYRHVTDSMRRIPVQGSPSNGVVGRLQDAELGAWARDQGRLILAVPRFPRSLKDLVIVLNEVFGNPFDLSEGEVLFFASRIWQVMTSSEERRKEEYEGIPWSDFIGVAQHSEGYRLAFSRSIRAFVAANPRRASTRTMGNMTIQSLLDMALPGGVADRILDAPTSDAWLRPWQGHLAQELGVEFRFETEVEAIRCDGVRITGVDVRSAGGSESLARDAFVSALPLEVLTKLLDAERTLERADPGLTRLRDLAHHLAWMNGAMFYLKRPTPIVKGHLIYVDSPWALTSVSQAQFWPGVDLAQAGDGQVRDVLSVCISDWETPGLQAGRARDCTREQILDEVWLQLKRHLNGNGTARLENENLHARYLDPAIEFAPDGSLLDNTEPLLVNDAGTWSLRPTAYTRIPNFFIAGDFVKTNTDLTTMEGANEAARRAVNHLLEQTGSRARRCKVWPLRRTPFIVRRWTDGRRFRRGLPWNGHLF